MGGMGRVVLAGLVGLLGLVGIGIVILIQLNTDYLCGIGLGIEIGWLLVKACGLTW
jgi:hypothetical protein